MKPIRDNFSAQAVLYKRYRPVYPNELYQSILKEVKERQKAWDCGTGNGQVAYKLSQHFAQIYATDISKKQLENAIQKDNILYEACRAEKTHFKEKQFDLITVAQAIHWFDFDQFYKEVRRAGKSGGILAVWGYGLLNIENSIDSLVSTFYSNIVGPYWDKERQYIDDAYKTIPFNFEEIPANKNFQMEHYWNLKEFLGYLNTWSSVQKFISQRNENPVDLIAKELNTIWQGHEKKKITFPLFLRMGLIG